MTVEKRLQELDGENAKKPERCQWKFFSAKKVVYNDANPKGPVKRMKEK